MLEMICAIPENFGWAMVGATAMLDAILFIQLGKTIFTAIKERIEEAKEDEVAE